LQVPITEAPHKQSSVTIRPATPADHQQILALNNAHVPAVSELTPDSLQHLATIAEPLSVVTLDSSPGDILGFIICIRPGKDYGSSNYAWVSSRFKSSFLYIDRVAFAQRAQGRGLGRRLYESVIARAEQLGCPLVCEVNTVPRNEQSLAFHARMGFSQIGEAAKPDGLTVAYLQRPAAAAQSLSGS
jgi:predicted GNAT superfamily acetyltransferase